MSKRKEALLDTVIPVFWEPKGHPSLTSFCKHFKAREGDILFVFAEPLSNKTHLIRGISEWLGEKMDVLSWGGVMRSAASTGRIPRLPFGQYTAEHNFEATAYTGELIEDWIREHKRDQFKRTLAVEVVLSKGRVEDKVSGEIIEVGVDRGFSVMCDLAKREGRFANLLGENNIKDAYIGIAVNPEGRRRGKEQRAELKKVIDPTQIREVFTKYGEDVSQISDEELVRYVDEAASIEAIEAIEHDINYLMELMSRKGRIPFQVWRSHLWWPIRDESMRSSVIAQYLLPELFTSRVNCGLDRPTDPLKSKFFIGRSHFLERLPFAKAPLLRRLV